MVAAASLAVTAFFAGTAQAQIPSNNAANYFVVSMNESALILVPDSFIREDTYAAGWALIFLPEPTESPNGSAQGAWIFSAYDCVNHLQVPLMVQIIAADGTILSSTQASAGQQIAPEVTQEGTFMDVALSLACVDERYETVKYTKEETIALIAAYDDAL